MPHSLSIAKMGILEANPKYGGLNCDFQQEITFSLSALIGNSFTSRYRLSIGPNQTHAKSIRRRRMNQMPRSECAWPGMLLAVLGPVRARRAESGASASAGTRRLT